jgi:hypothetical protein
VASPPLSLPPSSLSAASCCSRPHHAGEGVVPVPRLEQIDELKAVGGGSTTVGGRSTNRQRRVADRRIDDDGQPSPRALTVEDGRSSGSAATGGATALALNAETGLPPRRQWSGSGLASVAAATLSSREPTVTLG